MRRLDTNVISFLAAELGEQILLSAVTRIAAESS
jgi:hypothetical protein